MPMLAHAESKFLSATAPEQIVLELAYVDTDEFLMAL